MAAGEDQTKAIVRDAKGPSTNGADSDSPKEGKIGVSATLLQDLAIRRTAALRAALSVRPDIALIAITHNSTAQIFYDQKYLLPSSLTIRTTHMRTDSILGRRQNQSSLWLRGLPQSPIQNPSSTKPFLVKAFRSGVLEDDKSLGMPATTGQAFLRSFSKLLELVVTNICDLLGSQP